MKPRPDSTSKSARNSRRAALAVLIAALWLAGITMMVRRDANRTEAQQLTEVALRTQPATFYYTIERDGQQIGSASSAVDTTPNSLISEEYFVGDVASGKSTERTSARWRSKLTRGFRLTDLTINIARASGPRSINASVDGDTSLFIAGTNRPGGHPPARYSFTGPLFTPSLAPVAFMLGGDHTIGRKQTMAIFDPTTRLVIRPELRIRAESLFTVVDSAAAGPNGEWVGAHRDTIRAWQIEGGPQGLVAWVDAGGRLVAARAGSLTAIRTAFEIAFKNVKAK